MLKIPEILRTTIDDLNKNIINNIKGRKLKEPFFIMWNDMSALAKEKIASSIKDHSKRYQLEEVTLIDILSSLDTLNPCMITLDINKGGWAYTGQMNTGKLHSIERALILYIKKETINKKQLQTLIECMVCIPKYLYHLDIPTEPINTIITRIQSTYRRAHIRTYISSEISERFYKIYISPHTEIPSMMKPESARRNRNRVEEIDIYGVHNREFRDHYITIPRNSFNYTDGVTMNNNRPSIVFDEVDTNNETNNDTTEI